MLMRQQFELLRDAIESKHGTTDTVQFDGQSVTLADVFDELRSLSLLGSYKLITVNNADSFVSSHRKVIERYAQAPVEHATLVLRSGRWNRGNLDKLIKKVGCIVKCDPLPGPKAQAWIMQRATTEYHCPLTGTAASLLVERLGSDLMQLDSALAKLAIATDKGQSIQPALVNEQVTSQSNDEKAWVIQEAILTAISTSQGGRTATRTNSPNPTHRNSHGSAIEKIHQLIDHSGQAPVLVAYFVADLIRKLYGASMMLKQGHGPSEVTEKFKLWGPRRELFMRVLNQLDESKLTRLLDQVIQYDSWAKTGRGSSMRNLECFCTILGHPAQG